MAFGGQLVDTVEECAEALVGLLSDPLEAQRQAELGRERVREHFLLPRLLLNELSLMLDLERERPERRGELVAGALRDPVCGIALREGGAALWATLDGQGPCVLLGALPKRVLRGARAPGR